MALTEAQKAYNRKWYATHKLQKKKQATEYLAAHPDKAATYAATRKARSVKYRSKPSSKARQKAYMDARSGENRSLFRAILLHYDCQNPQCFSRHAGHVAEELQFHHLDPSQKENQISAMLTGKRSKTAAEINKCIVLCSNCHFRLHAGLIQVDESMLCQVDDDLQPLLYSSTKMPDHSTV